MIRAKAMRACAQQTESKLIFGPYKSNKKSGRLNRGNGPCVFLGSCMDLRVDAYAKLGL